MRSFKSTAKGILENEKASSGILTAVIIATVLAFNIVIFAIANMTTLSFTVQEKDKVVLTGNTDSLFEEAISQNKKVTIYFCFPSENDLIYHETGAFVHKTAKEYKARYGDFIEINYLNLITRKNESNGEDISEKIQKWQTDERGNKNYLARGSVIFECGNNYKVVTDTYSSAAFADFYTLDGSGNATSYNGEAFMASMIYWVTVNEHPTAYFTVGHSEQLDRAFATLLTSAGYLIDTVDLKKEEVPSDAGLLIISNPISDFEEALEGRTEKERLETYISGGGNIYVALDPYVKTLPVLEGLLSENGIEFSETEDNGTVIRNIVKDSSNAITTDGFTLVTDFADNDIAASIGGTVSKYSDGSVIVRETAALKLSKNAKPLLVTTPSSTLEASGERVDSEGSYPVAACVKIKGEREKVASLCVVSSVYISVSDALVTNGYSNTDFLYSLFDNFYGQDGMPYGCDVMKTDTQVLENMTMGTARLYTALIIAVPVAVAIVGTVVVIKRKNR